MMKRIQSADIFCKVIDNFGDAGVCWRLARALAMSGLSVRLWVDDLPRLQRLRPQLDVDLDLQPLDGFSVVHWTEHVPSDYQPSDLVIEAFGCRMPDRLIERMAATSPRPAWINLEYLSAEAWTRDSHGLPSPHPRWPLTQYFFFPGFASGRGGLLREPGIEVRHAAFGSAARDQFLGQLDICPPDDALLVSMFCYPQAPLAALLEAMRAGPRVMCLVPEGVAVDAVRHITGGPTAAGTEITLGQLTVRVIPFLEPDAYDRLLWSCDLNFVRGEDSAVRAHWAERPFVWQLYEQEEKAHLAKLDAFLDDFCEGLEPQEAGLVKRFWHAWNGGTAELPDWQALCHVLSRLALHHRQWAARMAGLGDLSGAIVEFAAKIR